VDSTLTNERVPLPFEDDALRCLDDVARFARSLTRAPDDADDLVQETYLRALRSRHTWKEGSDMRRWLFTICKNVFLRVHERARDQVALDDDPTNETLAAVLLHNKDRQFLLVLIWGTYVSLLVFVASDNWVWELAEDYPVKPIAEIVRQGTPVGQEVFTSHKLPRPSLNFYSERQVIVADAPTLKEKWQSLPQPYFLLEKPVFKHLALKNAEVVKTAEDWVLVTKK